MMRPAVSVIMPAYNHERYVAQAIESVLSQSFSDFEFIIVNDGSTDKTGEIIAHYTDPRIVYHCQSNTGSHAAINRGLELAKGRYISIINSDDVYHEKRLETLLHTAITERREFLITDIELIDADSNPVIDPRHWWVEWYEGLKEAYRTSDSPLKALLLGNYTIGTSNFFFEAALPLRIGSFRPRKYTLDYDFALRALRCNEGAFRFLLDTKLLLYRLHGKNAILENPLLANIETFSLLKRSIPSVFDDEIRPSIDHLNKIKRNIIKVRDRSWRKIIYGKEKEVLAHQEETDRLKMRLQEVDHFASTLLNSRVTIRNSLSYRLGALLTLPYRHVKGRIKNTTQTVKNVSELANAIKGFTHDVDIVSFDIFDTIFERYIEPPDRVKDIVARRFCNALKKLKGIETSAEAILALRNSIETRLRQDALAGGHDYECVFSILAREMVEEMLGAFDEEVFSALIECELSVEKEVLYVKDGMIDIIQRLKAIGKKLIAVSDMYLDREYLAEIFRAKGLDPYFDTIYVSSTDKVGKHSGRLFMHMILNETTMPDRIVHIGDNSRSDFDAPQNLGMKAIHFKDETSLRKRIVLKTYDSLQKSNPYFKGRHLMQLIRPAESGSDDFFYDYGFSTIGPIYMAFVYGILDEVETCRPEKLFFLAREGELFMDMYLLLTAGRSEDDGPASEYIYLTRGSTAPASVYRGLTHEKAIMAFFNPKQEGLHSLFNVYSLPHDEFIPLARAYGFHNIKEPIRDWKDKRLIALLGDDQFQAAVVKHATHHRTLLKDYLAQIGFFSYDRVAFIDIGWNGTIQKFIQDAFVDIPEYPHLYGYYLGFRNGIGHVFDKHKNTLKGVMYDDSSASPIDSIFMEFEELFEGGARALHPTTVGYQKNPVTGMVEPVFKASAPDRVAELDDNEKIKSIKRGAMNFCAEFKRVIALTDYRFSEIKPFILTLAERAVAFPKTDEVKQLMGLKHAEDFGSENIMDLNIDGVSSALALLRPRWLKSRLVTTNWRYGTVKKLSVPGANFLFRLCDIYRRL
jgi:glycosyltransferase involved in cell wall biosynthesis